MSMGRRPSYECANSCEVLLSIPQVIGSLSRTCAGQQAGRPAGGAASGGDGRKGVQRRLHLRQACGVWHAACGMPRVAYGVWHDRRTGTAQPVIHLI